MNRNIIVLVFLLVSSASFSNEMYSIDPVSYQISGNNENGEGAYQINIVVSREEESTIIKSLSVKIYEDSIEVDNGLLSTAIDPKIDQISATSDSGMLGSYVSIRIPFGKVGSWKFAKRHSSTKIIYISNFPKMDGGGLEARIIDPCHHQP